MGVGVGALGVGASWRARASSAARSAAQARYLEDRLLSECERLLVETRGGGGGGGFVPFEVEALRDMAMATVGETDSQRRAMEGVWPAVKVRLHQNKAFAIRRAGDAYMVVCASPEAMRPALLQGIRERSVSRERAAGRR